MRINFRPSARQEARLRSASLATAQIVCGPDRRLCLQSTAVRVRVVLKQVGPSAVHYVFETR